VLLRAVLFFAADFLAVVFLAAFLAVFFAVLLRAVLFLAALDFFAAVFFAVLLRAVVFFAGDFFAAVRFAALFFAGDRFAVFFAVARLAGDLLAGAVMPWSSLVKVDGVIRHYNKLDGDYGQSSIRRADLFCVGDCAVDVDQRRYTLEDHAQSLTPQGIQLCKVC
jgi:hypothetical protein